MRYGWLRKKSYYIGSGHVEAPVGVLICTGGTPRRTHVGHAHYRSHRTAA